MINTNKLAAEIMVLICVADKRNKITPATQIKIQHKIDEAIEKDMHEIAENTNKVAEPTPIKGLSKI